MNKVEDIRFRNTKGLSLSGLVSLPSANPPFPAVLILHGNTGNKSEAHIAHFAEILSAAGFLCLRFDASGFGESDGDVEVDYRVSNYLEDGKVAYRLLQKDPRVNPKRIAICGHSLGGCLALILAAQLSDVAACSAIQPITKITRSSTLTDLKAWQESGWLEYEAEHPRRQKFRIPWDFAVDADRINALDWVESIKCPVQIMYGTGDKRVVPSDTLSIYKKSPPATELVKLEGFVHDFKNFPEQLKVVSEKLKAFLLNCKETWEACKASQNQF